MKPRPSTSVQKPRPPEPRIVLPPVDYEGLLIEAPRPAPQIGWS